jgi:hypothetical protein
MSRLKCLVAACVLALTVGVGNASTFSVNGEFDNFVGQINPFPGHPLDLTNFPLPAKVNGTLAFTGGALTSLNLNVDPGAVFNGGATGPFYTTSAVSFSDAQNWSVTINGRSTGGLGDFIYQLDLTLTDMAGILTAAMFQVAQPGTFAFDSYVGNFTDFHGTVSQVPLPGALPLFATGLAGLGLLGWRRKRKAAAITA